MEFGDPPLFKILNIVMREGDKAYFESLGPYSVAMFYILSGAEYYRGDKIIPGWKMEDELKIDDFRGYFILFRGGAME